MAAGGKRPNSGRKKGVSYKTLVKVSDYYTKKEIRELIDDLKLRAKTDTKIAIYLAEQLTGKAPQAIDHTTNGKDLPTPIYSSKSLG